MKNVFYFSHVYLLQVASISAYRDMKIVSSTLSLHLHVTQLELCCQIVHRLLMKRMQYNS